MTENLGGTKRALLISISNYPYPHWKLDGCSNDMALMYRALSRQFGFPAENITMLRDEEATREGILAALENLVTSTGPDDIVVLHYAGHGSQMTCREGDEPDGLDETLVPFDSGRGDDENRDITDDELHIFLQRLGEKTRFTTLIFDCCHSGTITRDAFGGKTRSVKSDLRSIEELPPSPIAPETVTRATRNPGPSGWLSLSDKYVLIAGCAEAEESAEKTVGEDTFGALTWYLSRELERAGPGTTYRDVFEGMTGLVTANCARQHPQMEGTLDRELFGVRDIEPIRYVPVTAGARGTVTLGAGAAHGMTAGSRWAVVPAGTSEITDETDRLGEVEITSVGAVESQAKVLEGARTDEIVAGARAIETAHAYGDLRLRCQLIRPERDRPTDPLRDAIEASPLIVEVEEGADIRIYEIDQRPAPDGEVDPAAYPVPQLGAVGGTTLAAVGEQGELVVPVERLGERRGGDDEAALIENLESLARYRQGLAIENRDPGSRLREAVTMKLLRKRPDGELVSAEPEAAGGHVVFEEGEEFVLEIENVGSEDVYFNLIDFDPAGAVALVYPVRGANDKLAPRVPLQLPLRPSLPEKMPEASLARGDRPLEGTEIFKLFVSTEPADFSFLENRGFRSVGPAGAAAEPASPAELLMRTATGGVATRGVSLVVPTTESDWTTIEKTFVIREKSARSLSPDGAPVSLGSTTVKARGLEGEVTAHPWRSKRAASAQMMSGPFGAALESTEIETRQTLEISGTRADAPATRSVGSDAEPTVELELADPGSDYGDMLLVTSESGLLTWCFPEPAEAGPATRGLERGPGRSRRYVVDGSVEPAPDQPATRGLIGAVGKKFMQQLVFPLMDPVIGAVGDYFAGKFEAKRRPYRLRTFTPDDYLSAEAPAIDGELWEKLAAGQSLMFLHGTFSRAHTGFGSMPPEFLEELHRRYEGRVFAFDHHTLSQDPRANAEWLLEHMPPEIRLNVDLLCHARGGLVGRCLAEQQGDLSGGAERLRIGKVVFAGAPNAGTELADPKHLGALVDRYTNVLNLFDFIPIDTGVVEVIESIISVAKQLAMGTLGGLDGIQAMVPGGSFQQWLDKGRGMANTRYFALASDFRPADPTLERLLASKAARRVFPNGGNDLIVPTTSVFERRRKPRGDRGDEDGLFPILERHVFEGSALAHFDYFSNDEAREKIGNWLSD